MDGFILIASLTLRVRLFTPHEPFEIDYQDLPPLQCSRVFSTLK